MQEILPQDLVTLARNSGDENVMIQVGDGPVCVCNPTEEQRAEMEAFAAAQAEAAAEEAAATPDPAADVGGDNTGGDAGDTGVDADGNPNPPAA